MISIIYLKSKFKRLFLYLFFLGIILLLIISVILLLLNPFSSSEQKAYFIGEYPLLFDGEQRGNAEVIDQAIYVPVDFIKKHIDDTIWFDEKSASFIITTVNNVIQMPIDSPTFYVDESPIEYEFPTIRSHKDSLYIALKPISDYYALAFQMLPETNAIWLQLSGERVQQAAVIDKGRSEAELRLREQPSKRSPYTATVVQGEQLVVENERGDYYFVRKRNGVGGYLKKQHVENGKQKSITAEQPSTDSHPHQLNFTTPINLIWEAVYTKNPNTSDLSTMKGVNVVSPTWFKLLNKNGEISDNGSKEYVSWAKTNGYHVWGLFSNNFAPELTHEAFANFETRQAIIRQLLQFSKKYRLDGVNIDIENVYEADGPLITQFVREATPYFHAADLVVSMDITFIADGNWSAFYEREKLASIVDYLIVMAYDEHWATSPQAGSVASLPWVERNLQRLLEIVPNDHLILGIPLYTRLWKEEIGANGDIKLSSRALSMEAAQEWLEEKELTATFDAQTGQNYIEYHDPADNCLYKMWLEDETSLAKRIHVVESYKLAGVASWARYFADQTAWTTLGQLGRISVAEETK